MAIPNDKVGKRYFHTLAEQNKMIFNAAHHLYLG